jgi:gas vesicle structural protein
MSVVPSAGSGVAGPSRGSIADVVDLILEKGLVIDAYVRVSLIGIELLTIDARVVVASVDTYLRFAEKAQRLNLEETRRPGLPELIQGVAGAVAGVAGAVTGGGQQAPASLESAPDATELPAGVGDGHRQSEPAEVSAERGKESQR